MELLCLNCGFDMDARTANVQTNLIQCPSCHTIHRIDEILNMQETIDELPTKGFLKEKHKGPSIFENRKYELTNFEEDNLNFQSVPSDSKIEIYSTPTALEITIPAHGFEAADAFIILFTTFWLGFVAFWTFFAAMGSIFFAMFSIPFWLVGIGLASGLINKFTEKQFIELDRYSLNITKTGLLSKKVYMLDMEDIQAIRRQKPSMKSSFRNIQASGTAANKNNRLLPTIKTRNAEITIFEFVSEREQKWGIRILKEAITKYSKRKI